MDLRLATPRPRPLLRSTLIAAALLLALVVFAVLIHTATASSVPGADFYTFWVAGRALFLDHVDPYAQSVVEQTQMGKLGRLAKPDEDQQAFAYPPYALFPVLPVAPMMFDWAFSFWLALNVMAFLAVGFLALPRLAWLLSLSALVTFPIFLNFILGTFDILLSVGILIFYGLIVAQKRRSLAVQYTAALLLAWGTIKPQFIWLLLAFALIYAVRERLFPFLAAFFASLAGFTGLAFWLVPGWLPEWITRVQEYSRYVQGRPTLSDFLALVMPAQPALILTGIAFALCAAATIFLLVRWWKGEIHWLKMMAWMAMLTYLFHLHGISYEQIVFLLPMMLWMGQKGSWRDPELLVFWLAAILVSWLAFAYNTNSVAIDRSPVIFNAIWVARLFSKPGLQV